MMNHRISWVQIMALLALLGIILGVVGTGFLMMIPTSKTDPTTPSTISGEITP